MPEVTYEWYADVFGGRLPEAAFLASLAAGERHVRWLVGGRVPADAGEEAACKRAVCAAAEAIADYGDGQVDGFSLGDFEVKRYEREALSGAEIATEAAMRELAGTALLFCGVR